MRILLQRSDSGLYFEANDAWTADSAAAMDFVSSTAALEFCAAHKLAEVQIVLKFDAERSEIVLPAILPHTTRSQRPAQSV